MTSNLKVILSTVGVVALLASPALANTKHHRTATAAPAGSHGSAAPAAPHSFVTPYGADLPQPSHATGSVNPDFQVPGNY